VLNDNPFGYVAVIGNNGVLHFRVEHNGFADYAWLDITEPNVAFYQGQTNTATFTRQLALGGPVQYFPPADLAKASAGAWLAWADGSSPGATYTTNDFQFFLTGNNSLEFVTDGGFDTYVRYPGAGLAQWDLTLAQFLNLSLFAVNTNIAFQSGSPWIRLTDPTAIISNTSTSSVTAPRYSQRRHRPMAVVFHSARRLACGNQRLAPDCLWLAGHHADSKPGNPHGHLGFWLFRLA